MRFAIQVDLRCRHPFRRLLLGWLCVAVFSRVTVAAESTASIQFNRDVRPVLSDKCFRCHGPDGTARKAELRLDRRDDAVARDVIKPGAPQASLLIQRITATDDEVMPPRDSGLFLSARERTILRQWIEQGAEYSPHWSFVPPQAAPLPSSKSPMLRNPIDAFVDAELDRRGLVPAPAADSATALRRVSLALTGLPPSLDELDAHRSDQSPDAYERAVDRLLASPRYGERMAAMWLDAARYADTNGYFGDNTRQIWPWRDWVIEAFNRNMPFDQFTVEQLAGDLLPQATLAQQVATGFNRNHMATNETGVIDEEYRVEYVADRLETTGTVWLGLTVGCARCHDHKFDPLTQREYYELFAHFNNGPETGVITTDDPPPTLALATAEQQATLEHLLTKRTAADAALVRVVQAHRDSIAAWEQTGAVELSAPSDRLAAHVAFEPGLVAVDDGFQFEPGVLGNAGLLAAMGHLELSSRVLADADQAWSIGLWMKPTGSLNCVVAKTEPNESRRGLEILWAKGRIQVHLVHRWGVDAIAVKMKEPASKTDWHQIVVRYDGSRRAAGIKIFVDGLPVELQVERDALVGSINNDRPLSIGRRDNGLGYYGHFDELRIFGRAVNDAEVQRWYWTDRVHGTLALPAEKRDARQQLVLRDYFLQHHGDEAARAALQQAWRTKQTEDSFRAQLPTTLVMQDRADPRTTTVLLRGQYDAPGDKVQAGVPRWLLPPSKTGNAPAFAGNRLGLARWLTDSEHPLTARVAVNRLWEQCFGDGLVRSSNDFGSQGELPTHPELLDWLAHSFANHGWDVKQLLRLIVTSTTFRRSSIPTAKLLADDPENRLLGRGPRFRLPAEMIRDQALFASGLLVARMGGPPVKPYQPPGLWEAVSYDGDAEYSQDRGAGIWRRSLYTFWKRQAPPPAFSILDAPTRETCTVHRPRTNTPAQALVLLNDESYVDAARTLAALVCAATPTDGDRIRIAFLRVLSREPSNDESAVLLNLLQQQRIRFAADRPAAVRLVRSIDPTDAVVERAAWTAVGQVILNLDETVTSR